LQGKHACISIRRRQVNRGRGAREGR
jgi:hypothetical protein